MMNTVHIDKLRKVTKEVRRVGVIPYKIVNDKIYWLMGITKNGQFSDFGGGVKNSKGELPIDSLYREVLEEGGKSLCQHIKQSVNRKRGIKVFKVTSKNPNIFFYMALIPAHRYNVKSFVSNNENVAANWYLKDRILKYNQADFHPPIRKFISLIREGS